MSQLPDVLFVTCGGTIDKIYFDAKGGYEVGPPQVQEVLREANVGFSYDILTVLRKDSLEMTDEDRAAILATIAGHACRKVVVTHGTDTMILTARALQKAGLKDKTIVLTGSMQPARFQVSDAVFNIGSAVMAAQTLPAGVYLVMNGKVFDPAHSRKNVEENRFESCGGTEESRPDGC